MIQSSRLSLPLTQRFVPTGEDQAHFFGELTGITVPTLTRGCSAFLGEFGSWLRGYRPQSITDVRVLLSPDPTHVIGCPRPIEDLEMASRTARGAGLVPPSLSDVLELFHLHQSTCLQPTLTLSGGERALVALAKAYIMLPIAACAVICNPMGWLHKTRRALICETLHRCNEAAEPAVFICLRGDFDEESSSDVLARWHKEVSLPASLPWTLSISDPTVRFHETRFPVSVPERRISFVSRVRQLRLESPTLLCGDNGVGKSTFARAMASLIDLETGSITATIQGLSATPRLLIQETCYQLMGMAPLQHLEWVHRFDSGRKSLALQVFESIQKHTLSLLLKLDSSACAGGDTTAVTFLQAKTVLVAERLASGSKLLILDEPTWGLSLPYALAFLLAVVRQAHDMGVALLVISHDTRMPAPLFRSSLCFCEGESPDVVEVQG